MVRLMSIAILLGAIWLANLAVPRTDDQQRLKSAVGISLNGDPDSGSEIVYGRLPQDVFGQQRRSNRSIVLAGLTTPSKVSPFGIAEPGKLSEYRRAALLPLPARKPGVSGGSVTQAVAKVLRAPAFGWETETFKTVQVVLETAGTIPVNTPAARMTRAESRRVARHLQRELRRVGCYRGSADGIWGQQTRQAMQAFATQVSGNITTDRPDYISLMLVEKFDARACTDTTVVATKSSSAPEQRLASSEVVSVRQIRPVHARSTDTPEQKTLRTAERIANPVPGKFARVRRSLGGPVQAKAKIGDQQQTRGVTATRTRSNSLERIAVVRPTQPRQVASIRSPSIAQTGSPSRISAARKLRHRQKMRTARLIKASKRRRMGFGRRAQKRRYRLSKKHRVRLWSKRTFSNLR